MPYAQTEENMKFSKETDREFRCHFFPASNRETCDAYVRDNKQAGFASYDALQVAAESYSTYGVMCVGDSAQKFNHTNCCASVAADGQYSLAMCAECVHNMHNLCAIRGRFGRDSGYSL